MDRFVSRSPKWTQSQPVSTPSSHTIYSPTSGRVKVVHNLHSEMHFVSQVAYKSPLAELTCVTNTNIREKNFYQVFLQRTEHASGRPGTPLGVKAAARCLSALNNSSRSRHSMPSFRNDENQRPGSAGPKPNTTKIGEVSDYINTGDEEALAAGAVRIMRTPPSTIPLPGNSMKLDDLGKLASGDQPPYKHVPVREPTMRKTPPHNPVIQRIQRDLNSPSATVRLRALRAMKNPANSAYAHFDVPHEEQSIITEEERNPPPPPTIQEVMRNVVVYVEVRSGTENRSAGVQKVISALGARVNNRLRRDTTHVIFKDGLVSTYKKAKLWNIPVVSILWVEACKKKLTLCDPVEYQISNMHRYENPELYEKLKPIKDTQPDAERKVRKKVTPRNESTPKSNKKTAVLNGGETSSAKNKKTDISHYFKLLGSKTTTNQDGKDAIRMSAGGDRSTANETTVLLTPINPLNDGACITPVVNGTSSEQDFVFNVFVTPKNMTQATATNTACDDETPRASGAHRPLTRRLSRALAAHGQTVQLCQTMETTTNQTLKAHSPTKPTERSRAPRRQTTFTHKTLEMSLIDSAEAVKTRRTGLTPQLADVTIKTPQPDAKKTNRRRTLYTPQAVEVSSSRRRTLYTPKAMVEELSVADEPMKTSSRRRTLLPKKTLFSVQGENPPKQDETQQPKTPCTPASKTITKRAKPSEVDSESSKTVQQDAARPIVVEQLPPPATPTVSSDKNNRRRTLYKPKPVEVEVEDEANEASDVQENTSATPAVVFNEELSAPKPVRPAKEAPELLEAIDEETERQDGGDGAPTTEQAEPKQIIALIEDVAKQLEFTTRTLLARSASTEQQIYNPSLMQLRKSLTTPNLTMLLEKPKSLSSDSDVTLVAESSTDAVAEKTQVEEAAKEDVAPVEDVAAVEDVAPVEDVASVKAVVPQEAVTSAKAVAPVKAVAPPMKIAPPMAVQLSKNAAVTPVVLGTQKESDAPSTPSAQKRRKLYVPSSGLTTDFVPTSLNSSGGATKRRRTIMPLEAPDTPATPNRSATPKTKRAPRRSTLDFEFPKLADDACSNSTRIVRTPAANLLKSQPDMTLPSLVFTNMPKRQVDVVREAIKELGGFRLVKIVNDTTTHIVALESRRTLNLLRALIRGLWILDYTWIIDSLHAGRWLCEESYELKDFSRAVEICRAERQAFGIDYRCELFSQLGPFYISRHCGPVTKDNMRELIQLCGGKVTKSRQQAKFILGNISQMAEEKIYITPYWVLDSVTQMQIKPYRVNTEMVKLRTQDGTTKSAKTRY